MRGQVIQGHFIAITKHDGFLIAINSSNSGTGIARKALRSARIYQILIHVTFNAVALIWTMEFTEIKCIVVKTVEDLAAVQGFCGMSSVGVATGRAHTAQRS